MNIFKQQAKAKFFDRPRFRDVLHNQFDMTDDLIMDRGKCDNLFCVNFATEFINFKTYFQEMMYNCNCHFILPVIRNCFITVMAVCKNRPLWLDFIMIL